MALPKKRHSHARTRMRRAHDALKASTWITCAQCRNPMRLHRVCSECGYYRSKEIVVKTKRSA